MEERITTLNLPLQISEMKKFLVFAAVSILSFFVPFSLGHPQWLVGTVVNACLFLEAGFLPKKYFLPLAVLPSLGVLARGLVFGPFTYFLVYFLPFIWLGNLILILVFRLSSKLTVVNFDDKGFIFAVILAAFAKFLFLFLIANIYFKFSIVPALFLNSMGLNQLATALAGGTVSLLIFKLYGQHISRSRQVD